MPGRRDGRGGRGESYPPRSYGRAAEPNSLWRYSRRGGKQRPRLREVSSSFAAFLDADRWLEHPAANGAERRLSPGRIAVVAIQKIRTELHRNGRSCRFIGGLYGSPLRGMMIFETSRASWSRLPSEG